MLEAERGKVIRAGVARALRFRLTVRSCGDTQAV